MLGLLLLLLLQSLTVGLQWVRPEPQRLQAQGAKVYLLLAATLRSIPLLLLLSHLHMLLPHLLMLLLLLHLPMLLQVLQLLQQLLRLP